MCRRHSGQPCRQGVHFGNVDAGNEVFILCDAVVQIELLIGLHGLFGQVAQSGKVKAWAAASSSLIPSPPCP